MYEPCHIVPPHLLQAIADSTHNSESIRHSAKACLALREQVSLARKERFAALTMPRGYRTEEPVNIRRQQIIPEGILTHLAESENVDEDVRARAKRDLAHLQEVMARVHATQQGEFFPLFFCHCYYF